MQRLGEEGMTTTPAIALVTGARGGIGRAVTALLRGAGHRIMVCGRNRAGLVELDSDAMVAADVTTPEGAIAAVAACSEELGGPPTLLAHCVGNTLVAALHRTTVDQYRDVMRANVDSSVFVLHAWVEAMRSAGLKGTAVLCSSVVARVGVANHEAIAAAKGAVEALVRSAAATYATDGLRINAVAPGMTDTPMTAGMLRIDAMREGAGRQYPLGGVQTAEQVADAMAWLLSDRASRITGQVIPVDGGFTTVRPIAK